MIALILACASPAPQTTAGVECVDGHPHIRWESARAERVAWVAPTPPFVTTSTTIGDGCDEVSVTPHACGPGFAIVGDRIVSGPLPECVP